jgi:hypothetical protein
MIKKEPVDAYDDPHNPHFKHFLFTYPETDAFVTDICIQAYQGENKAVPYEVISVKRDQLAKYRRKAPEQDNEM